MRKAGRVVYPAAAVTKFFDEDLYFASAVKPTFLTCAFSVDLRHTQRLALPRRRREQNSVALVFK